MERLIELIKEAGIKDYCISGIHEESAELFFVKKKLDMRRIKDTEEIVITVIKDFEENGTKYRGTATIQGNPYLSNEEWISKLKNAAYSAEFVKNPFYELPGKEISEKVIVESSLNAYSLDEAAEGFVKEIFKEDTEEKSFINSLEIFSEKESVRVITSKGTDVSYEKRSIKGEFVSQCKALQDVETYQEFSFDEYDLEGIRALVKRTLKMTLDRAMAYEMPKSGTKDVVISDKYMAQLFKFYLDRANAAYIYQGYSNFSLGSKIQGENIKGEKLNMEYIQKVPFNDEGIKMGELSFVKEGILENIHGTMRFLDYLNLKKTGMYEKVRLKEGKVKLEDMLNQPVIYVVNFSDFQMDSFDGHFKGEIRLAYEYDGEGNVKFLTGGSINGSIFEAEKDFSFSMESIKTSDYEGPRAVLLKNVLISGSGK